MEARVRKCMLLCWMVRVLLMFLFACNAVIAQAQGNVSTLPATTRGSFEFSVVMYYLLPDRPWYPTLQSACEAQAVYLSGLRKEWAGAYCHKTFLVPANVNGYWYASIAFPNWVDWKLAVETVVVYPRVACPSGYGNGTYEWDYTTTPRSLVPECSRTAHCPANSTGVPANHPTTCICNEGYAPDSTGTSCEQANYTLELDRDSATIEPSGTTAGNGKASQEFTATVKSNGTPKSGAKVTIRADVQETSGYHNHHDDKRPKGTLGSKDGSATSCGAAGETHACITGTTNGNGQFTFSFTSSPVSGEHTLTATCEKCSNNPQVAEVKVMVEGLSQIPASPFYALNEKSGSVIGARIGWHTDNHNLTTAAAQKLMQVAIGYRFHPKFMLVVDQTTGRKDFPPVLHLNDASLPWGGVYDICSRPDACETLGIVAWKQPHVEHRRGTTIDVRANDENGAISDSNKQEFIRLLRRNKIPFLHEDKDTSNEHFHLRLLGRRE